jgi:hypothetical protein
VENLDQPAPLCFVLMPFGKKMDAGGRVTDFDAVYQQVIAPAVVLAGLEPVRAADAVPLRRGRHHRRQSERVL